MTTILNNTSEENKFVFWDGTNAKNISELYTKIKIMSPYVFRIYVNEKKNDFSSWIEKNYSDFALAQELSSCPRKGEILDCLHKAIDNSKGKTFNEATKGVFQQETKLKINNNNIKEKIPFLEVFSKQKLNNNNLSSAFIPENFFSNSFFKKPYQEKSRLNEQLKTAEQKEVQNVVKQIMFSKPNNISSQTQNNQIKPTQQLQKPIAKPIVEIKSAQIQKPTPTINPNKKVLLDEIISFELSEPNQAQEEINSKVSRIPFAATLKIFNKPLRQNDNQNSNVFKEPPAIKQQENILNAKKFNPLNVNDIIQRIKEVHR